MTGTGTTPKTGTKRGTSVVVPAITVTRPVTKKRTAGKKSTYIFFHKIREEWCGNLTDESMVTNVRAVNISTKTHHVFQTI